MSTTKILGARIMKLLCLFSQCKWVHITDIIIGVNKFSQNMVIGLYQCARCNAISKGACNNQPRQMESK